MSDHLHKLPSFRVPISILHQGRRGMLSPSHRAENPLLYLLSGFCPWFIINSVFKSTSLDHRNLGNPFWCEQSLAFSTIVLLRAQNFHLGIQSWASYLSFTSITLTPLPTLHEEDGCLADCKKERSYSSKWKREKHIVPIML